MTIDELKAKLPPELKPWADEYGPALLKMGAQGLKDWIQKLIKGDTLSAYKDVLANMDNAALLAEGRQLDAQWDSLNADNAESLSLQKKALTKLLEILLTIALATVGL